MDVRIIGANPTARRGFGASEGRRANESVTEQEGERPSELVSDHVDLLAAKWENKQSSTT